MHLDGLFDPSGVYLDTATYGLPPRVVFDAMIAALDDWRTGRTSEFAWETDAENARAAFARIVRVDPERVAIGATVSELLGLVAASLPNNTVVLTAENDFASTVFPFAAQGNRGITVRAVPLDELAASVTGDIGAVVVSHVQAQSGRVADLPALTAATKRVGAWLCVDGTQACGWLPTDASDIDVYVCHAYKWLLAPRGAAFLVVRPERLGAIVPHHAGWYATDDPNGNLFGLPIRLAATARRLDTSPAWFTWVGAARALATLETVGIDAIAEHDLRLARRFCDKLDLPPPPSPIVYVPLSDAFERLTRAGIRASVRGGRLRVSFHLYNSDGDVDIAVAAITAKASASSLG